MEIIKLKLEEIHLYSKNAKLHPDEQIQQIKESIKEFGFNDPIAIDEDNIIIEGNGRYKALTGLKEEGYEEINYNEIPCIRLTGLNQEQKKAYILVHNKLTMNTDFDLELLQEELKDIINIDMEQFDFNLDFLDEEEAEPEEDNFDVDSAIPDEPVSKLGDIYQLGNHRLMCGDSTKAEDVQKLMNGEHADLVVTDPPYNVNYGSINETGYGKERNNARKILNDNMDDNSFYHFLFDFYTQMLEALREGGAYYIFHSDSEGLNFRKALNDAGGPVKQTIIWVKNSFVLGRQDYQWKHEPCLYGWKEGAGHYFTFDRTNTTVYEDKIDFDKLKKEEAIALLKEIYSDKIKTTLVYEDKPKINDLHPTMKPIKLLAELIQNSSKKNDLVLDCFGGSGSTLITCEQLNRRCCMMEFDPHYVDVIIKRWEELTGKKAVKIN